MFYSNLSILGRRVFWAVLVILLTIAILVIHGAVRVKSTSLGGGTATASMSTGTNFGFVSLAAQGRSSATQTADNSGEGMEVITTDVFLYPTTAIYAEGHPVYISGSSSSKLGRLATTTIWVDEDEDGIRDAGEYITGPSSVFASYYIYGGSDSIPVSTNHISITMTGGEVGAIFAGGHYQNVTTQNVNIEITGGSVHYVDCGSMRGDGDISLIAFGTINVLLKDCIYRCNVPINAISKESFRCARVTVRDFSSHRNAQSYNRHYPIFNNYIAPIGLDSYVFGGNVTVPEDRDIHAAHIALADSVVVTNLGKVSVVSCQDIHKEKVSGAAVWNGNEISTSHREKKTLYYSYNTHTRECDDCHQIFTREHIWVYRHDNNSSPSTHTVKCGICDYSYCEPCDEVYSYDYSNYIRMKTCRFCRNETVVGKNNVANNQSPVCSHRNVSSVSLSKYHDELDPEGRKQYTSVHGAAKYCTDCKQILPFTLTYGGSEYHFRDLGPLSRFIIKYKIAQAEVKMNCDAFNTFWNDTLYTAATGVINFDLNGCDLIRKVYINSGRVNFTNSQFAANSTENHYAYIPYGDVIVKEGATASFDGCALRKLCVGERDGEVLGNVILKNVIVDNLYVSDASKLTIGGKVMITEQFQKSGTSMAPYIPVGYVMMENIGTGAWIKKFTRKESWTYSGQYAGPLGSEKCGYLGIMPCPQHKLSTASSNGSVTHTGTCLYCEASVRENHDLSAGEDRNDSIHTVKCNVCTYRKSGTESTAYHDYGMDGKCLVPGCNHQAAVSVHGQYSPLKTYFHSFDDALEAANVAGMHDTITMYKNQTVAHAITLNKKLVRIFTFMPRINLGNGAAVLRGTDLDSVVADSAPAPIAHAPAVFDLGVIALNKNNYTSMGPRIYIDGGTYQLDKAASGSINVNGMTANEHFRLEMSGNTSQFWSSLPITPAPGYAYGNRLASGAGAAWIKIIPCPHTSTQTYESIKDEYSTSVSGVDKYMADHKIICSNCNRVEYEKHNYITAGKFIICDKCNVFSTSVIAARVLWTTTSANGVSTEHMEGYKTLTEAWNGAIQTSINNGVECTIQVLTDINLGAEGGKSNYLHITELQKDAKIVLDAIDDEGREHSILAGSSTANAIIEAEYGKLTIKSGIYQGTKYAVGIKNGSNISLQGGTFLPGLYSTVSRNYNGLVYLGIDSYTLLRSLPNGYAISFLGAPRTIIADKFDILFGSNFYEIAARPNPVMAPKGRQPLYNPLTITDVSGTVMPCPHSSYREYKAVAPTCTQSGRPKYYFCEICKYYIKADNSAISEASENGNKYQKMGSIAELGHSFGTDKRCTRCNVYKDGIYYAEYDADGRLVSGHYGTVTGFASVWNKVYDLDKDAPEGHFIKVRLMADETVSAGTIVSPNTYKHPIEVDLNGYSLDFGSTVWQGHYPHLTVKDERRSGRSVLTGSFQEFEDEKVLVLDGMTYRTSKLNCPNLEMVNGAVLVMDGGIKDDASITLKNISMEEGCKMRGEGCSHFTLLNGAQYSGVYDYDLNESVADLAHSLGVTQLNGRGESVRGNGDPKIWNNSSSATGKRVVTVGTNPANTGYVYYASTCYTWEATKHDVEHALKGRECSECGHTTQHLMLFDGYSRNSSYHKSEYDDRQYKEVAYRCDNISQNVWTPLYVPFRIAPGVHTEDYDLADIYSFGRMYDTNGNGSIDPGDDTWLIVDLMTSGLTDPNYPYLVRMKSTTSSPYCFVGADGYAYAQALNSIGCSTAQTKYTFTGSNGGSAVPAGTLVMTDGALKPTSAVTTPRDHTWYVSPTSTVAGSAELRQALSSGIRVMLLGEDISEETAIRLLQGETVEVDIHGEHYTLDGRKATTTESGLKIVNGKKVIIK